MFQASSSLIMCIIDTNYCDFSNSLLQAGEDGGRSAAQCLTNAIADDIARQGIRLPRLFSFWIQMFIDRMGAKAKYVYSNRCSQTQLDAFFNGFSQTSPRCMLVDVISQGKGSATVKIDGTCIAFIHRSTTEFSISFCSFRNIANIHPFPTNPQNLLRRYAQRPLAY